MQANVVSTAIGGNRSGQVTEPAKMESHSLGPKGGDQDTDMQNEQRPARRWLQGAGVANHWSIPHRMQSENQSAELEQHDSVMCMARMVDMEQQTENEWNKDQLGTLMQQNTKLSRELEDLKREREALLEEARRERATKLPWKDPEKKLEDEKQQQKQEFLYFITRWKPCPASPFRAWRQQTALCESYVAVILRILGSSWRQRFTSVGAVCDDDDAELDQNYLYWA